MGTSPFLHVDFDKPKELEFDRRRVRRAFVKIGRVHMQDSRKLIMRRTRSAAGENPGYDTGRMARSIGYYVPRATKSRPGLMVKIAPNQKNGKENTHFSEGQAFYPAFLQHGVRQSSYGMSKKDRRNKQHHSSQFRLAPRNNFMIQTLEKRRAWTQSVLSKELEKSVKVKS